MFIINLERNFKIIIYLQIDKWDDLKNLGGAIGPQCVVGSHQFFVFD